MRSVLVIDDNVDLTHCLVIWFETKGFEVEGSLSIEDAAEKMQQRPYDAVLLDLRFPGDRSGDLSGLNFLKTIKQEYPDTSIIILTGDSEHSTVVEALNRGADAFMVKPFTMKELEEMVRGTLQQKEEMGFRRALSEMYVRVGHGMRIAKDALDGASRTVCATIESGKANGVILDTYLKEHDDIP